MTLSGDVAIESNMFDTNAHISKHFTVSAGVSEFIAKMSIQLEVDDRRYAPLPGVLKVMPACIDMVMHPGGYLGIPELDVKVSMKQLELSLSGLVDGVQEIDEEEARVVQSIEQLVNTLLVQ